MDDIEDGVEKGPIIQLYLVRAEVLRGINDETHAMEYRLVKARSWVQAVTLFRAHMERRRYYSVGLVEVLDTLE